MYESEGVKRAAEDEAKSVDSPSKRSRGEDNDSSKVELRILIPSKNAGAIIGKGGSNITRLRTEFKASITVPDCPGPERVLSISGDMDVACEVLMDIIPKLDDSVGYESRDFECEIRLLVHQSHAGCIIGRAGFKIKELREQTGAAIKVHSLCCPQSTDRVVQVSGKPNVVVDCLRLVHQLTEQSPVKGPRNPYDPHNYDSFFAQDYGGFLDPMGGGGGGRGGRGGRMDRMDGGGGGGGGGGRMGGGGGGQRHNMGMGRGGDNRGYRDGPMNRNSGGGGGGPRSGFRNGNSGGGNQGDFYNRRGAPQYGGGDDGGGNYGNQRMMGSGGGYNSYESGGPDFTSDSYGPSGHMQDDGMGNSTQVTIPKDLAGSIIGKGGTRIRKIRQDSGAGIVIDEALPGTNDRVITITGNASQIQMAQYLLQQSVREHSGRKF